MFRLRAAALIIMAIALPTLLRAQRAKPQTPASVEGDVYVLTQSGDTKRGAGRMVYLLKGPDIRDSIRTLCLQSIERRVALTNWRFALADSERRVRAGIIKDVDIYDILNRQSRVDKGIVAWNMETVAQVMPMIWRAVIDSVGTGMNAHYRFQIPSPGRYTLYSTWTMGENNYIWWAPLTIQAGKPLTRDLDNSVLLDRGVFCL